MPVTIPKPAVIPDRTKVDIGVETKKVKNLRFIFKDGQAQLMWDEVGPDAVIAHAMVMSDDGRRKYFVGGNWKSSGDAAFVEKFGNEVLQNIEFNKKSGDVVVAPPLIYAPQLNDLLYNQIEVGAQNISQHGPGAFTGQVNGQQLKDMDVPWAIVGHSERRFIFRETKEDIAAKVKEAMNNDIKVIYCIQQTSMDREVGPDHPMFGLKEELRTLIEMLPPEQWVNIVLAYEPLWALSRLEMSQNGETTDKIDIEAIDALIGHKEIQETHKMIRDFIETEVGPETAKFLRIIYAGPVSEHNAPELIQMEDVDGFLVHGEPALTEQFQQIVDDVDEHFKKGRDDEDGPGGGRGPSGGPTVMDR